MKISLVQSFLIILAVSGTTFFTRVFPFLFFPKGRVIPKTVVYLGKVLPPAVVGMLVVYCYKNADFMRVPFGLPEVLAGGTVVILHLWKRNNLLSIGSGTVLYMVLLQKVF